MKGVDVSNLLSGWTTQQARRSGLVLGLASAAIIAACGSDSATGPSSSSPTGSYTMSTVNGKTLPTSLFADGGFSYDVTSGKLSLTSDGKFSAVTNYRQTLPGSVENFVDSIGGTWTSSGTSVQMALSDGPDGGTRMDWSADVAIAGSLASLGARLIEGTANKMIGQTFDCMKTKLEA